MSKHGSTKVMITQFMYKSYETQLIFISYSTIYVHKLLPTLPNESSDKNLC
jgi:hypothetical protein